MPSPRFIFITGTDTGVGKTVLTVLLLLHLRQTGQRALATKLFCTGSRADAELLQLLQDRQLTLDQVNPFYFPEPVAPLIAARLHRSAIPIKKVLGHIRSTAQRIIRASTHSTTPFLIIEGAGGLFVPLSPGYTWADLVKKLSCEVMVVSANRLGTINHTLLTVKALQAIGNQELKVVIMDLLPPRHSTPDTHHNPPILAELLAPVPVFRLPFLGQNPLDPKTLEKNQKKFKKVLARILA